VGSPEPVGAPGGALDPAVESAIKGKY